MLFIFLFQVPTVQPQWVSGLPTSRKSPKAAAAPWRRPRLYHRHRLPSKKYSVSASSSNNSNSSSNNSNNNTNLIIKPPGMRVRILTQPLHPSRYVHKHM